MNVRDRIWPYLISILAAASVVIVTLDLSIPARAPLVLAFATICPGMALVRLMRLPEPLPELLLAFVVSLAVAGVVATMAIYLGAWNTKFILLAIVEVTLMAVLGDLLRPEPAAQ
jgi:hypothetical protein